MWVLNFLRKLFGKKTADQDYEAGFHWGYNEVSEGRLTPRDAENFYDNPFEGTAAFDRGAKNGVDTAIALHNIEDNRIF